MKIFIAVLFTFILHNVCCAQNNTGSSTDEKIQRNIQELSRKKADTIICYYVDCVGSIHVILKDSCDTYSMKYLLWVDSGQYFIQRFDECSDYMPLKIQPTFFHFLKKNFTRIKHEKLKNPEFDVIERGKKKTYSSFIDHSCHSTFEICIGKTRINKDIDAYALETKFVDYKYLNKNFYANKKSVLNKLKVITERVVDDYNKKLKTKKAP